VREGQRVLYISYDGLTDPLGRSQVLPYLIGLTRLGRSITILSCEKSARQAQDGDSVRAVCEEAGIIWHPIAYHKRPPILSSAYDALLLRRTAERLHRRDLFDIVHCRSYIPAIAGIYLKRKFGVRFLFDMRGFWAEEKVEGGSWKLDNPIFRAVYAYFKRLEAQFLGEADHVVSLTDAARKVMATWPAMADGADRVSVIPCCVDLDHFAVGTGVARQKGRAALGIARDRPVLVYLGSLGGNYMLDAMLDFFLAFRALRPGALFLFVTRDTPEMIERAAAAKGIRADELLVRSAGRMEVPAFVAAADMARRDAGGRNPRRRQRRCRRRRRGDHRIRGRSSRRQIRSRCARGCSRLCAQNSVWKCGYPRDSISMVQSRRWHRSL
jgi:glycosyltransferase involved in cell wall biosynthesis